MLESASSGVELPAAKSRDEIGKQRNKLRAHALENAGEIIGAERDSAKVVWRHTKSGHQVSKVARSSKAEFAA